MNIQKAITKAATEILMPRAAAVARKATVYIAPDSVVKITRQRKQPSVPLYARSIGYSNKPMHGNLNLAGRSRHR